jgi:hypothetical protein
VCAGSTSPSVVAVSPLLVDKPWFLNCGKTSRYTHHTFLLGFPTGWSFTTHKDLLLHVNYTPASILFWRHHQVAASFLAPLPETKEEYFQRLKKTSRVNLTPSKFFSGAVAGEEERTSARGVFRTHIHYFVIVLLYFIYFTCIVLYQKPKKKIESLVVVFTCLLSFC